MQTIQMVYLSKSIGALVQRVLISYVVFTVVSITCAAQPKTETFTGWEHLRSEAPAWLQEARFGIYFHWGVYTVPAHTSEWYSRSMYVPNTAPNKHHVATYGAPGQFGYKDFIPLFKAERFNADEWVDLFVRAGARFAGPVAEHADGFSMWNSNVNPWNAKAMGPMRDIVGEMEKAVRKRGLKFLTTFHHQWLWGWYPTFDKTVDAGNPSYASLYGPVVSEAAWQHKDSAERPDAAFCHTWLEKVKEVVRQYGPDLLYFDSRLNHINAECRKAVVESLLHTARKPGDKAVLYKSFDLPADVGVRTYEKSRMNRISEKIWLTEEPITTYSWSYTGDMELRAAKDILHVLIDVVSKNGVYLLNICPKADGTIPQDQKDILLKIGHWLAQNGEAVYGSRTWYTYGEGPRKEAEEKSTTLPNRREFHKLRFSAEDIRYTSKDNVVYAFVLGSPEKVSKLLLQSFAEERAGKKINISKVQLLGWGQKLRWSHTKEGLVVHVPASLKESPAAVFKIETR